MFSMTWKKKKENYEGVRKRDADWSMRDRQRGRISENDQTERQMGIRGTKEEEQKKGRLPYILSFPPLSYILEWSPRSNARTLYRYASNMLSRTCHVVKRTHERNPITMPCLPSTSHFKDFEVSPDEQFLNIFLPFSTSLLPTFISVRAFSRAYFVRPKWLLNFTMTFNENINHYIIITRIT